MRTKLEQCCDTPETFSEKFYSDYHGCYVCFAEHAEDLERERDEARFDLSFRRELYRLQEARVKDLEAEVALWKVDCDSHDEEVYREV